MAGPEMHYLNNGWLELESDPGLFTLLLEQFGCRGVQVEEIYDLSKPNLLDDHVFGFIFLFKWVEERRSRHRQLSSSAGSSNASISINSSTSQSSGSNIVNTSNSNASNDYNNPFYVEDEQLINSIFFAHQITPNSCATHALLSVLLNCKDVDLGVNLNKLRENTHLMSPENKGIAIGNIPELAKAHNRHAAHSDLLENSDKSNSSRGNGLSRTSATDSFHFVSFVAINNRVYELDGLKKFPIDHGPIGSNERFSEKFRQIILQRIPQQNSGQTNDGSVNCEDIRYSLMAVVPDRRIANRNKLQNLKQSRSFLLQTVQSMCRPVGLPKPYEFHNYCKYPEFSCKTSFELRPESCSIKPTMDTQTCDEVDNDRSMPASPHSTGSSTDTSSEVGSEFNSPIASGDEDEAEEADEDSPQNDRIQSLFMFKFTSNQMALLDSFSNSQGDRPDPVTADPESNVQEKTVPAESEIDAERLMQFYRKYAPKDLVRMLSKLQTEIEQCERNLCEEKDKRNKYRVDNARRTHNYDDFIATFLLMLTEQKKLPELLEKELRNGKNGAVRSESLSIKEGVSSLPDIASTFFEEIANDYESILLKAKKKKSVDLLVPEESKSARLIKKVAPPVAVVVRSEAKILQQSKTVVESPAKASAIGCVRSSPTKTVVAKKANQSPAVKQELLIMSPQQKTETDDAGSKSTSNEKTDEEDSGGLRRTSRKRTPKYPDPNYEVPGRAKRTTPTVNHH